MSIADGLEAGAAAIDKHAKKSPPKDVVASEALAFSQDKSGNQ
jgi:hypothetical protein